MTFLYHNVLHADDPPHRLALGAAIGVFVMFTPTIGFQMLISVLIAWLLKANKAIGLPVVWISNPATFIPIFYPSYLVGRVLLGWEPVSETWWRQIATPTTRMVARDCFLLVATPGDRRTAVAGRCRRGHGAGLCYVLHP